MDRGFITFLLLCQVAPSLANDREYRPARLQDGRVDLQGVWSHTNLTPFERPSDIDTFVITSEQAAQIKAKIDARNDDLSRPAEPSLYFDDRTVEPIRGELRSSVITNPTNGVIPGNARFKEAAAKAGAAVLSAFDGPEQRPHSERCLIAPSAGPPLLLIPASDLRQIVQTTDAIVIVTEELHEARVVRMNASHAPKVIRTWIGDSIGWWDGDTLTIETTGFAPASAVRAAPNGMLALSPDAVVVERITRVSPKELRYEFSVNDPHYYTQVWGGETRLRATDTPLLEYACHEGNYSLAYALQGARVQETNRANVTTATQARTESGVSQ